MFYFINNFVDFVLSEIGKIALGREGTERLFQTLAIAHQVQEFNVFVSTVNPNFIFPYPVQEDQPLLQSNLYVFARVGHKLAHFNLPSDNSVLDILGRRKTRKSFSFSRLNF